MRSVMARLAATSSQVKVTLTVSLAGVRRCLVSVRGWARYRSSRSSCPLGTVVVIQSIEHRARKLCTEWPTVFFALCMALSAQATIYFFYQPAPNHLRRRAMSGRIGLLNGHGRTVRSGGEDHGQAPVSRLIRGAAHRA
jgi:hypothetical protein